MLRPVVVLREGVLSAYDCVTVKRADDFPDALAVLMLSDDVIGHYRRTHSAFDDVNRPLESVSLVIAPDPVVL